MDPGTWIALGAMVVAAIAMLINFWKAVQERRATVAANRDQMTKAGAERDSIAVHSAEAALLLMEKMLNQSTTSAEKLQQRLEAAECQTAKCQQELQALRGAKGES